MTNLDDDTATADNLASLALFVNLAQTRPFTELLVVINLSHASKNYMLTTLHV